MKFTLGQVKEILPISQDTYRHWKTILPPLAARNGHTRCFMPGDLLALAVVRTLTEDVGIRVGNLQSTAIAIFDECNRNSWAGAERLALVVEPLRSRAATVSESQPPAMETTAIVLPLRPIVSHLRARLALGYEGPQQEPLRFPPTAVSAGRRRGDP